MSLNSYRNKNPHSVFVGEIFDYELKAGEESGTKRTIATTKSLESIADETSNSGYNQKAIMSIEGLVRPVSLSGDGNLPRLTTNGSELSYNTTSGEDNTIGNRYLNFLSNPSGNEFSELSELHDGNLGHDIEIVARHEYDDLTGQESGEVKSLVIPSNVSGGEYFSDYSDDYRFFALRGPLMINGWGYDTDGKPIPNEADVSADQGSFVLENTTNKFKSNFLKNPQDWPTAPLDVRFNRERGVWEASGGGGTTQNVTAEDYPYTKATVVNSTNSIIRPLESCVLYRQVTDRFNDIRLYSSYYNTLKDPVSSTDEEDRINPVESDWPLSSNDPPAGITGDHNLIEIDAPDLNSSGNFLAKRWPVATPVYYNIDNDYQLNEAAQRYTNDLERTVGVALEQINPGETGEVVIHGLVEAWVYVANINDRYAGPPLENSTRVGKIEIPDSKKVGYYGRFYEKSAIAIGSEKARFFRGNPSYAYSNSSGPIKIVRASRRDNEPAISYAPASESKHIGGYVISTNTDITSFNILNGALGNTIIITMYGETEVLDISTSVDSIDVETMKSDGWTLKLRTNKTVQTDERFMSVDIAVFTLRMFGNLDSNDEVYGKWLESNSSTLNRNSSYSEYRGINTSKISVSTDGVTPDPPRVSTNGQVYSMEQSYLSYRVP